MGDYLTDAERLAMAALIRSLEAVQWAIPIAKQGFICPSCRYQQARGHKCSCPIRLALRNAQRVIGAPVVELEDDDLIVERAVKALGLNGTGREAVRQAVDAAIAYGQRTQAPMETR